MVHFQAASATSDCETTPKAHPSRVSCTPEGSDIDEARLLSFDATMMQLQLEYNNNRTDDCQYDPEDPQSPTPQQFGGGRRPRTPPPQETPTRLRTVITPTKLDTGVIQRATTRRALQDVSTGASV
jgi:hypothetical protein